MTHLSFLHPMTQEHISQIESLTGKKVELVVEIIAQVDPQQPLIPQVVGLADACGLSRTEWENLPLLINPPSLNFIAVVLLAELHGRCGYFPAHLRMRAIQNVTPPQYEVADVLNLQAVRDAARRKRN